MFEVYSENVGSRFAIRVLHFRVKRMFLTAIDFCQLNWTLLLAHSTSCSSLNTLQLCLSVTCLKVTTLQKAPQKLLSGYDMPKTDVPAGPETEHPHHVAEMKKQHCCCFRDI